MLFDLFQKFIDVNSHLIQKSTSSLKEIKKTYNIFQIFKIKSQKSKLICLTYVWFASGFCFYGLILNLENLGGNIFYDSIVTFSGDILAEMLSGYCADEFGRVLVLKVSGLLGGFGFILYEIISEPNWLRTLFVFFTSLGFSGVFNVIYIYSPEAFPTSIRSTVMGFLYLVSRFGAILVPSFSAIVPHVNIFFSLLSIFSSYLCSFLPETLGEDIIDDIPEAMSGRQSSFLSKRIDKSQLCRASLMNMKRTFSNKSLINDFYFKVDEK